jgi:PKD repeat protein
LVFSVTFESIKQYSNQTFYLMNRIFYSVGIVAALLLSVFSSKAQTGCPNCKIDTSCFRFQDVSLCPAALPTACLDSSYSEDITFYMPQDLVYQGTAVTLKQIEIISISNVPPGLGWTVNSSNLIYTITSDPATQRGCVKICGIPTSLGTYAITVTVIATAGSPIGNQTVTQSFSIPLNVRVCSGGCNDYFCIGKDVECDTLTAVFNTLYTAPSPKILEYSWDYGDGGTSTVASPTHFYGTAGTYTPTLTLNQYDLTLDSVKITALGNWYSQQAFGACISDCDPDLYFQFQTGGPVFESPKRTDQLTSIWTKAELDAKNGNQPVIFSSSTPIIHLWEDDGGTFVNPDDDGGLTTQIITAPGTYNLSLTNSGGASGAVTLYVGKTLDTTIVQIDTILVKALPPATTIMALPDSVVCGGDSVTLQLYTGPYRYVWTKNDTSIIPLEGNNTYGIPGDIYAYKDSLSTIKALIIDTVTGCQIDVPTIHVLQKTPVGVVVASAGVFQINGTTLEAELGYSYQWLFNGLPISGATSGTYQPIVDSSYYSCICTNAGGCSDTSNEVFFIKKVTGINSVYDASSMINIYPNPSNGTVTLAVSKAFEDNVQLDVVNVMGENVYSENLGKVTSSLLKQLSLNELSNGNYIVRLSSGKMIAHKRLTITR